MKLIPIVLLVLLSACVKTIEHNKVNGSVSLIKTIDNVTVTVRLDPVVICYSYKNGEIPKPCDIFLRASIILSSPLSKHLSVELTNGIEYNTMVIVPGVTSSLLSTNINNSNNIYPDGMFSMKLSTFKLHE